MATKRIVPRATGEGGVGRTDKLMGPSYFSEYGLSSSIRRTEATLATTNATATVLWSKSIADNEVTLITVQVVCGTDNGATAGAYTRSCLVRKPGTGSAVIVSSTTMGIDLESNAYLNLTWSISGGNTIQMLATGIAATTINWRAEVATLTA